MFRSNVDVAVHDHHPAHEIGELPGISRPAVVSQRNQKLGMQLRHWTSRLFRKLRREVLSQHWNVIRPLAQWRKSQWNHVEPVVQIRAETSLFHHLLKRHVGGGDDSDIHRDRSRVAQPLNFTLLQHSQEFRLQFQRHLADLIE